MHPNTTLKFADDLSVVVPDSLNILTTYVLREQGDWFEDEIKFARLLLKPDQKAIDIGANYGLFTLSMAKTVGPGGIIWAFEPSSSAADLLSESVTVNGFGNVVLDRRALSDRAGLAYLSLNEHPELNALSRHGADSAGGVETVTVTTLDDAMREHCWSGIAFVKIDAEGEEPAIIRGGREFLQRQSPLIQYEVKAGSALHLEMVSQFASMGYDSYRLVPGLRALVPFDAQEPMDGYLFNLFCCKPERAALLATEGRLVLSQDTRSATLAHRLHALLRDRETASPLGWQNTLAQLPYGRNLGSEWRQTVSEGRSGEVEMALALHAIAHDDTFTMAERYLALRHSLEVLKAVCGERPDHLRLASLGRVAREFGARAIAVDAFDQLLQNSMKTQKIDPSEPFLATSERFDTLDPGEDLANWLICGTLEELERIGSFSSFYTGRAAQQRLEVIRDLGFGSPEMSRRLNLIEQRFCGSAGV